MIAEAGFTGPRRLALGTWRYTDRQPGWRTPPVPTNDRYTAAGAYVLLEQPILSGDDANPAATFFARLGVSDGRTSPFSGGWQAGVLVERPVHSRPDSILSFGINQGVISDAERQNAADDGRDIERTETAFELTYADRIGRVTIQPDLQYVIQPAGNRAATNPLVATLRFSVTF